MKNIDNLFDRARDKRALRVCVCVAHDQHVLDSVCKAKRMGLADFVLIGDKGKILDIAMTHGLDLSSLQIVDHADPIQACAMAVNLANQGKANAVMKGLVDTKILLKAVLDKDNGMRGENLLSHLAVFEVASYHKLLYVTDSAINIAPDYAAKKAIIKNSIKAVQNLGLASPKVALIAAKEKVDPKMPVTLEYQQLLQEAKSEGDFGAAIIDGPLALDNAVSVESCKTKGIVSPVGGDADILFCPNIEVGNVLYKSLSFLANAKNGGIVLGAKLPIILTSRADSVDSKLISIALGVVV